METAELRPLSLGELLDRTFTLYRTHFWVFVGIMVIPSAFGIPVNYLALSAEGNMFRNAGPPFGAGAPAPPPMGQIFGILAGVFAFWIVLMVVYSIAVAAATRAVSETYLGRAATVRDSYRSVGRKFWRLIGIDLNLLVRVIGIFILVFFAFGLVIAALGAATTVLGNQEAIAVVMGILVILLYISALIGVLYLALRYALTVPALMLEDLGTFASIRRSIQLTRGRRGHIFIAFLLAMVIYYVGFILFQAPFFISTMISMMKSHGIPAWLALSSAVAGAMGGSITGPVLMIMIVLCYYDTRIRKEAFDLQFMMQSLDRAAAPQAASPGSVPSA